MKLYWIVFLVLLGIHAVCYWFFPSIKLILIEANIGDTLNFIFWTLLIATGLFEGKKDSSREKKQKSILIVFIGIVLFLYCLFKYVCSFIYPELYANLNTEMYKLGFTSILFAWFICSKTHNGLFSDIKKFK